MRFLAYLLVLLTIALPLQAQEEEESGGIIANLLTGALSGENRYVRVYGLEGALSSRATIDRLTFSDDDGIWLTIEGAELDWSRSALLRGNLLVETLRAEEIEVARLPGETTQGEELPSPEATPAALQEKANR